MQCGIYVYASTQKFNIQKKDVKYYGLLTGMSNVQIIILSSIIIKLYLVIYLSLIYTKNILPYIIMIFLADIIYIILNHKKIIFESINAIAQIILLYFINILKQYKIEVSSELYIEQIIYVLIAFIILYCSYFSLKKFEQLIIKKGKVNEKKS